jgi:hypothetical protein
MALLSITMGTTPLDVVWDLLSLPPGRLVPALGLLAAFIVVCELTRIALATVLTRSVLAHVTICLLTFPVQAIGLAVVLEHAAQRYPERGFLNLAFAAGLYVIWYVIGRVTRLVRPISEGADLGFMSVGALITFPVGVLAALSCR